RLNGDPRLSVERLAELLRSQSHRLGELDDGLRTVRSGFMVSYQGLEPDAAVMFRRLGLHDGDDFGPATAAALAGVDEERAARLLADLVTAHLVEASASGRFAMHDLLRLFARERAESDETEVDRDRAVERMLHGNLGTARNALRAMGSPA